MNRVGHGHVFSPAAMPRTFRKQLTWRVRAATSSSGHVTQTHSLDIRRSTPRRGIAYPTCFHLGLICACSSPVSNLAYLVRDLVAQIGEWWQPTREAAEGDLTMEEMTQQLQVSCTSLRFDLCSRVNWRAPKWSPSQVWN